MSLRAQGLNFRRQGPISGHSFTLKLKIREFGTQRPRFRSAATHIQFSRVATQTQKCRGPRSGCRVPPGLSFRTQEPKFRTRTQGPKFKTQ